MSEERARRDVPVGMTRAVLSLGSNLGDRARHLSNAVAALGDSVVRTSSIYRTPPWGPVAQDDYYNIVLIVQAEGVDGYGWLERCRSLEQAAGRVRDIRWGPRTLDVDVIVAGDEVSEDPDLILPHPRAHERAFVLLPWAEVEPDAELPGFGAVSDLLGALDVSEITVVGHVG